MAPQFWLTNSCSADLDCRFAVSLSETEKWRQDELDSDILAHWRKTFGSETEKAIDDVVKAFKFEMMRK